MKDQITGTDWFFLFVLFFPQPLMIVSWQFTTCSGNALSQLDETFSSCLGKKSLSQINISKLSNGGYVILLINTWLAYSMKNSSHRLSKDASSAALV